VRGRTFPPQEATPGHAVAIIGYDLWQGQFGADRHIVDKHVDLAGRPFTVIGVMPPGFEFPGTTQIWVPEELWTAFTLFGEQGLSNFEIGRLKPDVTPKRARSELLVFFRHIKRLDPASFNPKVSVTPLHLVLVEDIRRSLLVLMGAVGLVLVIACVNVANLLMTRNAGRVHEMAIRSAIGAGRGWVARQLLTESVMLTLVGRTVGLLIADGGVRFARAFIPAGQLGAVRIGSDSRVLFFTLAVAVVIGLLSGLLPAFAMSSVQPREALKEAVSAGSAMRWARGYRFRGILVSGEVALALILLIGAGLLLKSLAALSDVNPGFRTNHLLCARFFLTEPGYAAAASRTAFFDQIVDRARNLPGVREAAFVNSVPMGAGGLLAFTVGIEGSVTLNPESSGKFALYFSASPEYFQAMGVPLVAGREFNERDLANSPRVVIVNQTAARQYWPNQSPIGKRITLVIAPKSLRVVGVVGDIRQGNLTEKPRPAVYLPISQAPPKSAFLVLHVSRRLLSSDVTRVVRSVDRDEPVSYIRTGRELLARTTAKPRFRAAVLGILSGSAILLACIGIYGVVSNIVTQRTHEIGVRMALGATKSDVVRLIVSQGIVFSLIGIGAGIAGGLGLTRVLASFLYDTSPTDPATWIATGALLAAVALLACYIPARRATKIDPMVALRHE
jgi:putative ABC transport system permease protein